MKSLRIPLKKVLLNDGILAVFLLGLFLATNGYTFGWDDQHLEIPLLKSLIDPALYAGDYYVESLKKNFSSILYPLLARTISVQQIPSVYLGFYLISRYFFFFWIYKLWALISKSKLTGFLCVVMFIVLGRVEEFLYRTFSHQEFALAVIMSGLYFFYRERFVLAAFIFGMAANFHSLYSLFPFIYMLAYLSTHLSRYGSRTLFKTSAAFLLSLCPLIIWMRAKLFMPGADTSVDLQEWVHLYQLACPQNFIFLDVDIKDVTKNLSLFWRATAPYWPIFCLTMLNQWHNPVFQRDRKVKTILITAAFFLFLSLIFTYIFPQRFILDLNLVRHTQFMLFFLWGYTVILIMTLIKDRSDLAVLALSLCLPLIRFGTYISPLAVILMTAILVVGKGCRSQHQEERGRIRPVMAYGTILLGLGVIFRTVLIDKFNTPTLIMIKIIWILLLTNYLILRHVKKPAWETVLRVLFLIIPLTAFSLHYTFYHFKRLEIEKKAAGFWQLQRNWEDMQHYVRMNTPQDALLLVPYDMTMGGFRIFSERKIICSYRDCGIVGFDYQTARAWKKKVEDIEPFKVIAKEDITPAIQNALFKYKVNYIVFMNYLAPKANPVMKPVYRNGVFSLYKVLINPR